LFIQRAKRVGFTLSEIEELLMLDEKANCDEASQLAQQKLKLVTEKINELIQIKHVLQTYVADCEDNTENDSCGIIKSLKNPTS
jgi:MerR family mercuric resistance operon transcriptional regulator